MTDVEIAQRIFFTFWNRKDFRSLVVVQTEKSIQLNKKLWNKIEIKEIKNIQCKLA